MIIVDDTYPSLHYNYDSRNKSSSWNTWRFDSTKDRLSGLSGGVSPWDTRNITLFSLDHGQLVQSDIYPQQPRYQWAYHTSTWPLQAVPASQTQVIFYNNTRPMGKYAVRLILSSGHGYQH